MLTIWTILLNCVKITETTPQNYYNHYHYLQFFLKEGTFYASHFRTFEN